MFRTDMIHDKDDTRVVWTLSDDYDLDCAIGVTVSEINMSPELITKVKKYDYATHNKNVNLLAEMALYTNINPNNFSRQYDIRLIISIDRVLEHIAENFLSEDDVLNKKLVDIIKLTHIGIDFSTFSAYLGWELK